jgi:NAD+ diphosphatase
MQNLISQQLPGTKIGFISSDIDRRADLRSDSGAILTYRQSDSARFIGISGDAVASRDQKPDYDRPFAPAGEVETIFLGLDAGLDPWFAYRANSAVPTLALRPILLGGLLPEVELSRFAQARSLVHWHERHGFCANCGAPTTMQDAGYRRQCPACKAEHFPRTDPVVIMVAMHGGAILLGRQAAWPEGMYSALAGFMEPGETIEQAVIRETWEEAGVRVRDVRYIASQPWPFPASLMIGVHAVAEERSLHVDGNELQDARWFERDEINLMLNRKHPGNLYAANPYAIAHHLIGQAIEHV